MLEEGDEIKVETESELLGNGKYYCINFEGGKIIEHAMYSENCLAYANVQITMDAPYDQIIATEEARTCGSIETQLKEYNESELIVSLNMIFDYIITNFDKRLIVIQIARGKSATKTLSLLSDILENILHSGNKYMIKVGYKTKDYFKIPNEKFIFVNIGMIARLTYIYNFPAGSVVNPFVTIDVDMASVPDSELDPISIIAKKIRYHTDNKNILNKFCTIPKHILFGISDAMPFVTPDIYKKEMIQELINNVSKSWNLLIELQFNQ